MTNETNGVATTGGPAGAGMTDAEKLTALQTYMKALKPLEEALRAAVAADLKVRKVEKVGAYLPDGEKLGAVGLNPGRKTATVTDSGAALRWALAHRPEAVVQTVAPAFLKALTDYAAKVGEPGEPGVDPETGEVLDFIEVRQGNPFVTVTTTKEGIARMTQLAHGFAGMLEAPAEPVDEQNPTYGPGQGPAYDPDFAGQRQPGWPTHVRTVRDLWDEEPDPWGEETK
jgi:hypothetical protein